ncbi:hypothetical protein ZHAS_00021816 [Anopheles sinensis]|uniref:Uncharacterized protein n=1 Tax=Anopheles sinensis TaxID=74873 RepID=A0A084WT71_ANOSI|nr:hypothetical protein ZHAS_00021816 [Anopheles sinensis]
MVTTHTFATPGVDGVDEDGMVVKKKEASTKRRRKPTRCVRSLPKKHGPKTKARSVQSLTASETDVSSEGSAQFREDLVEAAVPGARWSVKG